MRFPNVRLVILAAAVAAVVSCDGSATATRIGSGISGGPTGTAPIVPPAPGSIDSFPPLVIIDQPVATPRQLVNVGDSIFVQVRLNDDRALGSVQITGLTESGDPDLGTFQRTVRYTTITVPATGGFRPGLTDTTVRRYLKPVLPIDTALGPMIIEVVGRDSSGNATTARRIIEIVAGPRVVIQDYPDSLPVGRTSTFRVVSSHPVGVARDSVHIQSDPSQPWPTPINRHLVSTYPAGTRTASREIDLVIPANAPLRSRVIINATAFDASQNPGRAAPVVLFTRAAGTQPPIVHQTVPARMEKTDFFTVSAEGDGIAAIGRIIRDRNGNTLRTDTVVRYTEFKGNRTAQLPLLDSLGLQGQTVEIISFAIDNNTPPLIGFSIPATSRLPVSSVAQAHRDTTFVTYGRTFGAPRTGVMGDLAVDPIRGNVFLSNTRHNLLEVWDNTTRTFATNGVPVGAQPWGLFQSRAPDTLLVGNSGATTISRVFIGTSDKTQMREALARRIRTRETVIYVVQFFRDVSTGKVRLIELPWVAYSDRPQYVVESAGGRIFFSTRPTSAATPGTIRWLDPALPFPDPQIITSYIEEDETSQNFVYSIFNVDSIRIGATPPTTLGSDTLYLFDHPYGQIGPTIVGIDSFPVTAINSLRAQGSDAFTILNGDLETLELTDTTFVAASGDRNWIAFGEGNTIGRPGRIMMVNDPVGPFPGFFSPAITVNDIVDNASDRVFGVAIDRTGLQVSVHGLQTYMAAVDQPFHLRLDGAYDSFDNGAGVAYHPDANSTLSAPEQRVAFSATSSGVIEVIDVAHYNNRGQFTTKGNLYGALRVSLPLPGDNVGLTCPGNPNCVVLKIFGLTDAGMVVIDVRAVDIKPAP